MVAPGAIAADDFRAHRQLIGTCLLAPGEAEALASPGLNPVVVQRRQLMSIGRDDSYPAEAEVADEPRSSRYRA